ncbi:hypothetical protein O6P43_017616 [Quillaja saponaria]|uniref:Uncharacterized protein n=1 Tax=Quillaja saponaria TaxID=32244 RepID=A0AAD7PNJ6_QUISA|nr:hypothetical protein O6P43_017616 [Quillaja saponaria]
MNKPRNQMKPTTKTSFSSNFTPKCLVKLHSTLPLKPKSLFLNMKTHCSNSPNPSSSETPILISIFKAIPDWADSVQERGMQQKRTLYDHEKWVQHRSSLRHVRHLLSSLSSRVILSLVPPVIAFTSVAALIASYNSAVLMHWLPEFFPVLRASSLPYQLTASALALLLVFRTEASYSRYQEGRKAWTKVIAVTNDFARQVMAGVDNSGDMQLKKALLQYIVAFPVVLKCHVLNGSDVRRDIQNLLEVDDAAIVLNSKHRPRCIIEFISQSLRLIKLEESRRNILESNITCFLEGIGVCEQLMGIPIPLSYTRLTSRFLVLWHLTLPIILWDDCQWFVVPATFISAAALFCIEEVGVLIEEPFPMLPLDELCKKVQKDIQEAVATKSLIQAHIAIKGKSHAKEHSANGRPNS